MTVGIAIVGAGIFVKDEHLPAVRACTDLILKAVYSRSLKSAKGVVEDGPEVDLYSDDSGEGKNYGDLLLRSDIGAVIIALPILDQPEYIKLALAAGKHVLSEKPIAENVKDADELVKWYRSKIEPRGVTWAVAENFRYQNRYAYAAEQVQKLGRLLSFRLRANTMVEKGGKYYETQWRRTPKHQGGFVLDGGVHSVAALRLLLGSDVVMRLSCFTSQKLEHLPPVDNVDATLRTKSGATGTVSISFGTTLKGSECAVGCEGGSVDVSSDKVTTVINGKEEVKQIQDDSGVPGEVSDWAKALMAGKQNEKQKPEEALADLELIEKMLRSGEADGTPLDCVFQI